MKLHVPFTKLGEATRVFLVDHPTAVLHDVSGDDGAYQDYLAAQWAEGTDFINLEHDVVPWPGAIEELGNCPGGWCVFGYTARWDCLRETPPLGLAKFSTSFIRATHGVWEVYEAAHGRAWGACDAHLSSYAKGRGIYPHQHFPAVLNANLSRLDSFR